MKVCKRAFALTLMLSLLLLIGKSTGEPRESINYAKVENTTETEYWARSEANHPVHLKTFLDVTKSFINLIQSKQLLPEGTLTVKNRTIETNFNGAKIAKHYMGPIILSCLLVLLAIILPCVGCYLCCSSAICYDPHEITYRDNDGKDLRSSKKCTGFTLLIVFVLLVIGFYFAVHTNVSVARGTKELPDYLNNTVHDLRFYVVGITNDMELLLRSNFKELSYNLIDSLETAGNAVIEMLSKVPKMEAVKRADNFIVGLEHIETELKSIVNITKGLKSNATKLDEEFKRINTDLLEIVEKCGQNCEKIKEEIQKNDINVSKELEKLPMTEVETALRNVEKLFDDGIIEGVGKGKEEFERIQNEIQTEVNKTVPEAQKKIDQVDDKLADVFQDVSNKVNETFLSVIESKVEPKIDEARGRLNDNSAYGFAMGSVMCLVILLVIVPVFIVLISLCCQSEDVYDKGCLTSCCLTTTILLVLCVSSLMMLITVVFMLSGVLSERVLCEPLREPNDNQIIKLVDDLMDFRNLSFGSVEPHKLTVGGIIDACHENNSLVKVFKLEDVVDADYWMNYTNNYNINKTIDEVMEKIKLHQSEYELINDKTIAKLKELVSSGVTDINFSEYKKILEQPLTSFSLDEYAGKIRDFSRGLPAELKEKLEKSANAVEECQKDYIDPMMNSSRALVNSLSNLEREIKFGEESLQAAVDNLIESVKEAQNWINTEAPKEIKTIASTLGKDLYARIKGFVIRVTGSIANNVGKCGPISNLYKSTIVAGCDNLIDPLNGFWLSVGWCLLLFIPVLILGVRLNSLQKRTDFDVAFGLAKGTRRVEPKNPLYAEGPYSLTARRNNINNDQSPFRRNYGTRASKYY